MLSARNNQIPRVNIFHVFFKNCPGPGRSTDYCQHCNLLCDFKETNFNTCINLQCAFFSERMLFRKFDITHYGVAFVEDMFMDIPPTSILVSHEFEDLV